MQYEFFRKGYRIEGLEAGKRLNSEMGMGKENSLNKWAGRFGCYKAGKQGKTVC